MRYRDFPRATALALLAIASATPAALAAGTDGPDPNIIFVMADDWGYGDLGCYNAQSKIPTPNIDRLAEEGMRFTDAHSPAAVCTPTRYALLTGRYAWRSRLKRGVFGGYDYPLIEEHRLTLASLLNQQGYSTACIGKWHLGLHWGLKPGATRDEDGNYRQSSIDFTKPIAGGPNDLGFDYFFGTAGCTTDDPPICFIENNHTVGIPDTMTALDTAFEDREMLMVPGFKHEQADIEFTNKAIWFMEDQLIKHPGDPFFIYLALSIPHVPWLPPELVKEKSQAGPRGDQCVLIDWCVGQLTEALDRLHIRENTLIIITSDNGPRPGINGHQSAGDLRGYKGSIYEGGHRVPLVVRWPARIQPGVTCGALVTFTDMMATCAAITGATLPDGAGEDSFNFLPVLLGEDLTGREMVINHSGGDQFAIRQGNWKLIHEVGRRTDDQLRGELYDLEADPSEQRDQWGQHSLLAAEMLRTLQTQKERGYTRQN